MERDRHRRLYDLHSWTGITLGWFVYLVTLTGCFALFEKEIRTWEDPARRLTLPAQGAPMQSALERFVAEASAGMEIRFVAFTPATGIEPYHAARVGTRATDGTSGMVHRRWNVATGEPLPEHAMGLSEWLLEFHRSLMWPDAWGGYRVGRTLVGIAGVALLLSLLTGALIHTKWARSFHVLRVDRSDRLRWQDLHKVLGLWLLPFASAIAATGAMLGMVVVSPAAVFLAIGGDRSAIDRGNRPPPAPPTAERAATAMLPIERFLEIRHPATGHVPALVQFRRWGEPDATAELRFPVEERLARYEIRVVNAVSAAEVPGHAGNRPVTTAQRLYGTVAPLHFGTYGTLATKVVYALLGTLLAIAVLLGNAMWISRRSRLGAVSTASRRYRRLDRANVGIALGIPLATFACFHADKLWFGAAGSPRVGIGAVYLSVAAATGLYAAVRSDRDAALRELLRLLAGLCVGVPLVDAATGGGLVAIEDLGRGVPHAWVNASALLTGLAIWAATPGLSRFAARSARRAAAARGDADADEGTRA
ncbi:MAG: PepSY-associated TM helix domain-containing protein [Myxococcota bacterium]